MVQIPFGTQSYQSRSRPFSSQRMLNAYVERAEIQARSDVLVQGTEGLKLFSDTGAQEVGGMGLFGGTLYVVADQSLLRVAADGATEHIGQIPGVGRAFLESSGTHLAILRNNLLTVYDGEQLTRVTDPDFPGATSMAYMSGFFVFSQPESGRFFTSQLLDPASYDALDFATAEGNPDGLVSVFVDHQELLLFGERTIEVWNASANEDFPFERNANSFVERGVASTRSVAGLDNSVFWLGDDLLFYRLDGYTPKVLSHEGIASVVRQLEHPETCEAFGYSHDRHTFYVASFPIDGVTLVYDVATNLWHERSSWNVGAWRAQDHQFVYGKHLVSDRVSGKLFCLDFETYTDDGQPIERLITTPPMHGESARVAMTRLELLFERGVGTDQENARDPQVVLDWSDDGGRTYGNEHWRSLGKLGEFRRRAVWHRLGSYFERTFRIRMTDPVRFALLRADAEMTPRRP